MYRNSLSKGIDQERGFPKHVNVPWNIMKTIMNQWKKCSIRLTLPGVGYPSKIDNEENFREATKRPTATL